MTSSHVNNYNAYTCTCIYNSEMHMLHREQEYKTIFPREVWTHNLFGTVMLKASKKVETSDWKILWIKKRDIALGIVEKAGQQNWTLWADHVPLIMPSWTMVPMYMLLNAGNQPTSHTL